MGNILQRLKGIKVTPLIGPSNGKAGEAFGAFITDADCKLGFNGQATEININLVHESSRNELGKTFDPPLNKATLSSSLTQPAKVPNGYRIEFLGSNFSNPIAFEPMFLYSYDTSLEPDSKTSSVVFKDYSLILDKIYIGLAFRQYYPNKAQIQHAQIQGNVNEICPGCGFDNKTLLLKTYTVFRDIKMSSCFFGITNTSVLNNAFSFPAADPKATPRAGEEQRPGYPALWRDVVENFFKKANIKVAATSYVNQSFLGVGAVTYPDRLEMSINGGALYLGTEQFKEEFCGGTTVVDYNFSELLASLVLNGLIVRNILFETEPVNPLEALNPDPNDPNNLDLKKPLNPSRVFKAVFSQGVNSFDIDRNPRYRQNYSGTLKEVLGNWCSDFGLHFHFHGTELVFSDSSKAKLDVNTKIKQIFEDPNFKEGNPFVVNSYKASASLDGTYAQGIITSHVKSKQMKEDSKSVAYSVGYLPLHPIALYTSPIGLVPRETIYGEQYFGPRFVDPADPITNNGREWFTNRLITDVDSSIALNHYSPTLRNIYCGSRFDDTNDYSHLGALGFFPVQEFLSPEVKQAIINALMQGGTDENQQNIVLLQEYFRVLIGYHYPSIQSETADWEKSMADAMYSYGVLVKGTSPIFPFVPPDANTQPGFQNQDGDALTSYFRLTKDFDPSAQQYRKRKDLPYKDAVPLSGFGLHTGYYVAQLDNLWGTKPETFNQFLRTLSRNNECNKYFGQSLYNEDLMDDIKPQNWSLEDFEPKFFGDLAAVSIDIREQLDALHLTDATEITYLRKTNDLTNQSECKKLHICIIPLTRTHPNIRIEFSASINQNNRTLINNGEMLKNLTERVEAERIRQAKEEMLTVCDLSLKKITCEQGTVESLLKLVGGQIDLKNPLSQDPIPSQYAYGARGICAPDPGRNDKNWEGFDIMPSNIYLEQNSRYLIVNVTRNPSPDLQNFDKDGDGYIQLSDFISLSAQNQKIVAPPFVIVYPISRKANGDELYYGGIMTVNTSTKTIIPETIEIYGVDEIFDQKRTNEGFASIKIVNQTLDSDIDASYNPTAKEFSPRVYDIAGNQIVSVKEFHDGSRKAIHSVYSPIESVNLRFGGLSLPQDIRDLMTPLAGLSSLSLKIGDNGEFLDVTFNSRPAEPPKQEALLNKIKHRMA